jgi:hypothetical protein
MRHGEARRGKSRGDRLIKWLPEDTYTGDGPVSLILFTFSFFRWDDVAVDSVAVCRFRAG